MSLSQEDNAPPLCIDHFSGFCLSRFHCHPHPQKRRSSFGTSAGMLRGGGGAGGGPRPISAASGCSSGCSGGENSCHNSENKDKTTIIITNNNNTKQFLCHLIVSLSEKPASREIRKRQLFDSKTHSFRGSMPSTKWPEVRFQGATFVSGDRSNDARLS